MNDTWITVTVHPNARKELLLGLGPDRFEAWVRAKPVQGNANEAVARLLAQTLAIRLAQLRLVRGATGRHKVFRILA